MARADVKLGWEWRAGRGLAQRAAIRIGSVKPEGGGLFGILRSPSLAGSLPDAMKVEAMVVAVDRKGVAATGAHIAVRVPRMELNEAKPGDLVAIGIIGQSAVCLQIAPAATGDADASEWLREAFN